MRKTWGIVLMTALALGAGPGSAQVRTIDPNQAIDGDLAPNQSTARGTTPPADSARADPPQSYQDEPVDAGQPANGPADTAPADTRDRTADRNAPPPGPGADGARAQADAKSAQGETFEKQELLRAAEGTFGQGASGLAGILERTLKEQGRPNAYIAGREGSAAIAVGLRYGKGTMYHKVEGQQPVYWTGPSLGFDLGGDANKVFVLVYNLYDSEDLFKRFPAAEGRLYFVGGFAATYLRRGNIVLIPIRLGVGWRQGVNIGYMKFSHKSKWFPF